MTHPTTAMEAWQDAMCKRTMSLAIPSTHAAADQAAASVLEAWKDEQVRELLHALHKAERIIYGIEDYMKRPGRGDWGEECACCMGELLDDDQDDIALIRHLLAGERGE